MTDPTNAGERSPLVARPIFRWLAGISSAACILTAVFFFFPQLFGDSGETDIPVAVMMLWCAFILGSITVSGQLPGRVGKQRLKIFLAAKQYDAGDITLEEYASRTKHILNND